VRGEEAKAGRDRVHVNEHEKKKKKQENKDLPGKWEAKGPRRDVTASMSIASLASMRLYSARSPFCGYS